jgi:ATP-dependent exoDNAse (exonuclease V) alpha subunit
MAKHLSLRLAWHNGGWNGHICQCPKKNIYCIGQFSYPSTHIANNRDLDFETKNAGYSCSKYEDIVACSNSVNAFGRDTVKNKSVPPIFYYDDAEVRFFDMPPATACTWPYEKMFEEGEKYDYNHKLEAAKNFFGDLTSNKSLIIYYANKSNPFSQDDNKVYVLVGIARLKKVGDIMYYNNVSEKNRQRYAGGFIWQMPVTSHYPDEGFKIPYHKYMNNEEVLNNILYIPEQSNNFKYAARHITDDDALIYIERLINIVQYLIEIKDDSENWEERKKWLQSLLAELWISRGAYPGMGSLLDYLDCNELISYYYEQSKKNNSKNVAESIFDFFDRKNRSKLINCSITDEVLDAYCRNWYTKLRNDELRQFAKLLARIAIDKEQFEHIVFDSRAQNGITASIPDIVKNLYIISEQYSGNDIGDDIPFTKIDHAVLPSPDLGIEMLYQKNDWRRLRALMVNELKYETIHSFVNQNTVLEKLNDKLVHYPDWKKEVFNEGHIEYDKTEIEQAIRFKTVEEKTYLYLNEVYNDERFIEKNIKDLIGRGEIILAKPFSEERWKNELYVTDRDLARKADKEYHDAIKEQIKICSQIFNKACSVVSGSAGTGKTTAIKAIIKAIEFTSGQTESICLLAPTGKAADRIRQKTNKEAQTIHSFLTKNNWLNFNNWTLKQSGGKKSDEYTTYIIDESSMIDLHLMAGLFRSIDWDVVKRIIFVGDPNQLPPTGRGKVFANIIEYIKEVYPDNYGELNINIRQMENKISEKGTGILDLASLYIKKDNNHQQIEALLKQIQESDDDVTQDLRITTWKDTDDLEQKLTATIEKDLEESNANDMMNHQIISPYRGELYGTDNINKVIQKLRNDYNINKKGNLAGITVFDKIIQITNCAKTNAYYSYNVENRQKDRVDVFNGELGIVKIHNFDKDDYKKSNFHLKRFQVSFEQKPNQFVDFLSESEVENNIELGYAISVHKAQGSEFSKVYFVLPKSKQTLLSTELLYTGITRAQKHLTVFVESDFTTLLAMTRPEKSRLSLINSSVFDFKPLPEKMLQGRWYEESKIHSTLTQYLVRSKSEVIIANMLFKSGIENIKYEEPLFASDGTFYLPDFTIQWKGKTYYWEHLGILDMPKYKRHWEEKQKWYEKHFAGQLITTEESTSLSIDVKNLISKLKRNEL